MLFLCFPGGEMRCRRMGTWEEGQQADRGNRMGKQTREEDRQADEGTGWVGEEDRDIVGG